MQCMNLTMAEKEALEAAGYTIVGGPYASLAQCSSECDVTDTGTGAGPTVMCGSCPVPQTLYMHITDLGGCSCLGGRVFEMDGATGTWWTGNAPPGNPDVSLSGACGPFNEVRCSLVCSGGSLILSFSCDAGAPTASISGSPDTFSCSPFLFEKTGSLSGGDACCTGSIKITILETP